MIQNLKKTFPQPNIVFKYINNGILFLYKKQSGTYLMLDKYVESFTKDDSNKGIPLNNFHSINESHPLFYKLLRLYQVQYLPAIIVIKNAKILRVVNGPILKSELLNHISILENSENA